MGPKDYGAGSVEIDGSLRAAAAVVGWHGRMRETAREGMAEIDIAGGSCASGYVAGVGAAADSEEYQGYTVGVCGGISVVERRMESGAGRF